jgi:hypothetical protein
MPFIPSIPNDWITHTGILPAANGYVTRVKKVLRKVGGFYPYAIHTAYESDGKWNYEKGDYFPRLKEAQIEFSKFCNGT